MTEAVVLDEYPPYLMAHLTLPPMPGTATADLRGARSHNTLMNPNGASAAAVGVSWRQIRRALSQTPLCGYGASAQISPWRWRSVAYYVRRPWQLKSCDWARSSELTRTQRTSCLRSGPTTSRRHALPGEPGRHAPHCGINGVDLSRSSQPLRMTRCNTM